MRLAAGDVVTSQEPNLSRWPQWRIRAGTASGKRACWHRAETGDSEATRLLCVAFRAIESLATTCTP